MLWIHYHYRLSTISNSNSRELWPMLKSVELLLYEKNVSWQPRLHKIVIESLSYCENQPFQRIRDVVLSKRLRLKSFQQCCAPFVTLAPPTRIILTLGFRGVKVGHVRGGGVVRLKLCTVSVWFFRHPTPLRIWVFIKRHGADYYEVFSPKVFT